MSRTLYIQESGTITREQWQKIKVAANAVGIGSRDILRVDHAAMTNAEKAGMNPEEVKTFYELVAEVAQKTPLAYDEVENELLRLYSINQQPTSMNDLEYFKQTQDPRTVLVHEKLNKFSQKGHPGLGLMDLTTDAGTILKAKDRNKSSKGKHPSNYTPPKKKRK